MEKGSKSYHVEIISADVRDLEIVDRENYILCLEPDPKKDSTIIVLQLREPLNNFPLEIKTILRLKIIIVAIEGVNDGLRNNRSFLEFAFLRFFIHFTMCNVHVLGFDLLINLFFQFQIVFANSFDGPEGLALVEVFDLFLVRYLMPLILM